MCLCLCVCVCLDSLLLRRRFEHLNRLCEVDEQEAQRCLGERGRSTVM